MVMKQEISHLTPSHKKKNQNQHSTRENQFLFYPLKAKREWEITKL